MKKQIISIFLIVSLVFTFSMATTAEGSDSDKTNLWGVALQDYVTNPIGEDTAVIRSLEIAKDNEVILPQIEIEQAKDFYIVAGYEEGEALDLAITYVREINTLYQEAIKNGYTVTDDEISTHLTQLNTAFQSAQNKDEIYSFINSFGSLQSYWNFQFEMLKKDLPIQKYVAEKEAAFLSTKLSNSFASKSYNTQEYANEVMKVQEEWVAEFENLKDTVKTAYSYKIE